mmetsp:Transcript_17198/g.28575  ORF Transcript_17198/g.28575 Transcript_17198/m.28575 type:complete len:262 (-) Transcript_17198:11-796(-)
MGKRKNNNISSKGNNNAATNTAKPVGKNKEAIIIEPLPANLLLKRKKQSKAAAAISLDTLHPQAVYVGRNFLSPTECRSWIDFVDATTSDQGGGKSSQMEFVSHPATRFIAHRTCHRWQRQGCWTMAQALWERIQDTGILRQLDFGFDDTKQYQPTICNGNLRLYKYEKGMSFGRHVDGSNQTDRGRTEVTVLIYLSGCQGGATRFYTPTSRKKERSFAFAPEAGAILLHVHGDKCLEHEADPVTGGDKYVLRTDLVYTHQ